MQPILFIVFLPLLAAIIDRRLGVAAIYAAIAAVAEGGGQAGGGLGDRARHQVAAVREDIVHAHAKP